MCVIIMISTVVVPVVAVCSLSHLVFAVLPSFRLTALAFTLHAITLAVIPLILLAILMDTLARLLGW
jgi:hypothetical protein